MHFISFYDCYPYHRLLFIVAGPEEPQKEEIPSPPPPPPAQLQLQLGGSLEQLLREGGRPGSSLEKLKSEFAAYLPKVILAAVACLLCCCCCCW